MLHAELFVATNKRDMHSYFILFLHTGSTNAVPHIRNAQLLTPKVSRYLSTTMRCRYNAVNFLYTFTTFLYSIEYRKACAP